MRYLITEHAEGGNVLSTREAEGHSRLMALWHEFGPMRGIRTVIDSPTHSIWRFGTVFYMVTEVQGEDS
jgi:hypothetical protein